MTVAPLHPDSAEPFHPDRPESNPLATNGGSEDFARAFDGVGALLDRAQRSEDAFAGHRGSLIDAMYERGRADVMLAVATAAMQRAAQSLQSIANMQV